MGIGDLGGWFRKRLDAAGAQANVFDNGATYNTVMQNRQIQPGPSVFHQLDQFGRGVVHPFSTFGSAVINTPDAIWREMQNKPIDDIQRKVFGTNDSANIAKQIAGDTAMLGLTVVAPGASRLADAAAARVLPAAAPRLGVRIASNAMSGPALGVGFTEANIPARGQNFTKQNVIQAAKSGASGGLAFGVLPPAAFGAAKGSVRIVRGAMNEPPRPAASAAPTPPPVAKPPEQAMNVPVVQARQPVTEIQAAEASAKKVNPPEPYQPGYTTRIKNRGFMDHMMNDPATSPAIKQALVELDTTYRTRNTEALQVKAKNFTDQNPDMARSIANNVVDDKSLAIASEHWAREQARAADLAKVGHQHESDAIFSNVIEQADTAAKNLTEAGRFSQAASVYGRIAPEGIVRFAQRELNRYNEMTGKNIKLNPTDAQRLVKMAEDIQKMPEGYERTASTAQLVSQVHQLMPASLAEHLSTLQTMAQLLNPKTNIRNIGGNTLFGGLENISQSIATPVDKLLSLATGRRTTTLPSVTVQAHGAAEGLKTGIREAKQGINTGPTTQFDLSSVPVFRGKILGALEKTMNGTLRGADRAAYKAAFDDTINGLLKLNKTDRATPEMIEQAHYTGLYRTFQDSNAISDFFVGLKKSLNKVGIGTDGPRFGLGDIILKYPKTPGNLLARGVDYSPAGFVNAIFQAAKPLIGKPFDQKAFVDSFSRAVVGSGSAFGIGYAMAKNGIITAQPEKNKDLRNVQKTAGLGGYQINASAFKRWVLSGFNGDAAKLRKGDTLVSYDWAQPIAIPVSAGAALGQNKPKKAGAESVNTIVESTNTLAEQPLLQGVQRFFGNAQGSGGVAGAFQGAATDVPASFVPTAVNQVNQLMDNTSRNTQSGKGGIVGIVTDSANQARAKIPGLAQGLPARVDVLGNPMQRYQDNGNNPFNVFLNPAFVSHYNPQPAASEVLDLYNRTGETKQTPNTVGKSVSITNDQGNPQRISLSGAQQGQFQQYMGKATADSIGKLVQDPAYQSLPDSEKVNLLSNLQTNIASAGKVQIFHDNPKNISPGTVSVLAGGADLSSSAQDIQNKVAVEKFKSSGQKTMQIGDTYYFKTKAGDVKSMPKIEYDYNQADSALNLGMDRAQAGDDISTWMKLAEQKYNALESKKQLYDPGTEKDKIDAITLAQENLMQKVEKYASYGGFKKGNAGKGVAKGSLPSVDVAIPGGLSSPVVSRANYQAPKFQLKNKGGPSVRIARKKVKISAPKKLA